MERLANGILAATGCRSRCSEITGPSRRGRLVGVMRRTLQRLRGCFFAFRFVSDFRRRQPIVTIEQIFSDGSSETKWPPGSKRNALPKRAGKPPEGLRRNLRDTGGEKTVGRSGMASGKKPFARRDVLRSRPQSGDRAAAAGCPRALKPRARSAAQVRQTAASIRVSGFTGPVLFGRSSNPDCEGEAEYRRHGLARFHPTALGIGMGCGQKLRRVFCGSANGSHISALRDPVAPQRIISARCGKLILRCHLLSQR